MPMRKEADRVDGACGQQRFKNGFQLTETYSWEKVKVKSFSRV